MIDQFKDKTILITGGTGSIGQVTIHELLKHDPAIIRIMDIDETKLFELQQEFSEYEEKLRFLLGNVYDEKRLYHALENVDIIFHMASLKHVFSCEYNPFEAVKTNVIGTQNLINASKNQEVEKVIFTSSDKAVNPCNVMGTTKLLGERLMIAANYYRGRRKTIFSSVRFGNVIGSRGSIIPLFKNQIKKREMVTITNPEMTRFVMSSSQAVNLLLKATEMAQGGEIFIFKMSVIKPIDIAKVMINELTLKNDLKAERIKMKTIGNKPGEKIYEELMTEDESKEALETDNMFIVLPQMKELHPEINSSLYNANPARRGNYSSNSVNPLSEKEILDLLKRENLL